jgi:hypothetical protein
VRKPKRKGAARIDCLAINDIDTPVKGVEFV